MRERRKEILAGITVGGDKSEDDVATKRLPQDLKLKELLIDKSLRELNNRLG